MLRGSRPGERRGGRKRGTPHRRTILRDRILSIGLDHPAASQRAFLLKLVKDRKLPADTRMANVLATIRTISLGKELTFTILDGKTQPPVKLRLQLPNDQGFQKLYKKLPASIGALAVRTT